MQAVVFILEGDHSANIKEQVGNLTLEWSRRVNSLLAHLSRRLMGELIVYQSLRRPSVRPPSVRQHFQTSSPLKPLDQLNSKFHMETP